MYAQPTICAIDVGYGFTKFAYRDKHTGEIRKDRFPSLVPPAKRKTPIESDQLRDDSMNTNRDTCIVRLDNKLYEVGKQVDHLDGDRKHTIQHDDYISTYHYKVLLFGALTYMGQRVIDVLVVGLPVHIYYQHEKSLGQLCTGTHKINHNTTVEVKKCVVVPQPYGALIHHNLNQTSDDRGNKPPRQTNLVFDIGFHTTDWISTEKLVLKDHSCGSDSTGMSEILKELHRRYKIPLQRVEEYVRYGSVLDIDGEMVDFRLEAQSIMPEVLSSTFAAFDNSLGNLKGLIDNVLLAGGAAFLMRPFIEESFKSTQANISVIEDHENANVLGFLAIGEHIYSKGNAA